MTQQPTTLYIIGNGFDLLHGVKSSYSAFREYLKRHDKSLSFEMDCYFECENFWGDFENNLAFLSREMVMESVDTMLQGKPVVKAALSTSECTGFLLRSPLVRGWRGLEFKAYAGSEILTALRLEALSEDVLLGLYRGVIDKLEILEPPESFHFGFNRNGENLSKRLRGLQDGILTETEVPVAQRGNRVVDFCRTADTMRNALGVEITSAHMALEMIQNPHLAVIDKK
jgi:hypothetical protein